MTDLATSNTSTPAARLTGWDSIEFWVGNARAMAGFLTGSFGFRVHRLLGSRDRPPRQGVVPARAGEHQARGHLGSHARIGDLESRPQPR